MPLIQSSSEQAFRKNVATEISSGKDPKQAVAIAYSIKRKNDGLDYKPQCKPGMSLSDFEDIVHNTIQYIKAKYPNEHNTMDRWITLIGEEFGEICKAINDGDCNNTVEECTQTIAAIYLMLQDFVDKYTK